jgi:hypothetical protein
MKQAEHWGCGSIPMLNQTGELKEAFGKSKDGSARRRTLGVGGGGEIATLASPRARVSTTRPMSCSALRSRSCPACRGNISRRRCCGGLRPEGGNLHAACSKTISPFSLPMLDVRCPRRSRRRGACLLGEEALIVSPFFPWGAPACVVSGMAGLSGRWLHPSLARVDGQCALLFLQKEKRNPNQPLEPDSLVG